MIIKTIQFKDPMRSIIYAACAFLALGAFQVQSQPVRTTGDYASRPLWIGMMDDPGANFFEIQKAFYTWWKDKPTHRGDGYKPFKRWEYFWQMRINPDGSFPEPGKVYREYNKFAEAHPLPIQFKSGQTRWVELGPKTRIDLGGYVGLGRLNAIACHPADTSIIYVAAPSGGIWKTTDGGKNWLPLSESLPSLGASAILIHPARHDELLVGTGDRDHGDARGIGVIRSIDGGRTWVTWNSGMGEATVGMFARHETNPDIILAATNKGIFKTTNGGQTWVLKSDISASYKDIKFKPGDMNVAYATSTGGTGFYRSENGGETWTQVPFENGLPDGGRMVIGVSPALNTMVYIVGGAQTFQGCFVSTDEGKTFTAQSTTPNILGYAADGSDDKSQAWYDLDMIVDPENVQVLYVGGINLWRSDNGGKTWKIISFWNGSGPSVVHADQHAFFYNPLNKRLYAGNDGGIYYTENKGTSWTEITEGLGIGQIYKLGVSATNRYKTTVGFQDNGSATWIGGDWMGSGGGDGMECAVDPIDYQYSYTTLYYGAITQYLFNGSNKQVGGEGVGGIDESGAWVTPFLIHEENPDIMVAGYKNIWVTEELKNPERTLWRKISNNLAGRNDAYITVLEQSPANTNMLFAVRADKKLFRTDDFLTWPVAWKDLSDGLPEGYWLSDVECHPYDPEVVYITLNQRVYKSSDRGSTWTDISGSLPDIAIFTIVFDKSGTEELYIGTDAGVYYKGDGMDDWILYNNGLPASARVSELEIYYDRLDRNDSRIRASTFGRGLWEAGLAPLNNPQQPTFLTAAPSGDNISLTWNSPFYPQNVAGYRVFRNGSFWADSPVPYYTDNEIEREVSYVYQVTAVYTDGNESAKSNRAMAILADPAVLPYSRDFNTGTAGWEANYFHGGWEYGDAADLGIPGNTGHFFGISSSSAPEGTWVSDVVYSPEIDLSPYAGSKATLSFKYAFRNTDQGDHLAAVYRLSPDSSWTVFYKFPDPVSNTWEWKSLDLELPAEAMAKAVQVGFRYFNSRIPAGGAGIDDVSIIAGTAGVSLTGTVFRMEVYPNPTNGMVNIEFYAPGPGPVIIKVINLNGQTVVQKTIDQVGTVNTVTLDLRGRPKGIYQIMIRSSAREITKKISIQ